MHYLVFNPHHNVMSSSEIVGFDISFRFTWEILLKNITLEIICRPSSYLEFIRNLLPKKYKYEDHM